MRSTRIEVLAGLVFIFGWAGFTSAATINVPGDFATIQAAINAAVSGVDEVVVAPGTYNEAIDFIGKAITLRSSGGAAVTILDGTGLSSSVVTTFNGEGPDTVLDGFTITNGMGTDSIGLGPSGGGMQNLNTSPTITNCVFTGNFVTGLGGGMFNFSSSPTVTNCTFLNNSAGKGGGGMYNRQSNSTVTNCTFSGNSASSGGGMLTQLGSSNITNVTNCVFIGNTADANGGGMATDTLSSIAVTDCTFSGNSASKGGGMSNDVGVGLITVTNCTFSGNSAQSVGGGMATGAGTNTVTGCTFVDNSAAEGGGMYNVVDPTVTSCTFIGNSAAEGGGMANRGIGSNSPTVTNCIFSGNTAGQGGGMANSLGGSNPSVTNCTFSGNSAGGFGGAMSNTFSSSPIVTNCTLWGNSRDFPGPQIFNGDATSVPVISFSDIEGSGGSAGWDITLGVNGGGNIDADPLFVDPLGPDGLAGTVDDNLRLLTSSPVIDTADNTAVPPDTADLDGDGNTTEPIPVDLDGNMRFVDNSSTPDSGNGTAPILDLGAYEFQGTVEPIPTVSEWGLVTLLLLILTTGTIVMRRRVTCACPAFTWMRGCTRQ